MKNSGWTRIFGTLALLVATLTMATAPRAQATPLFGLTYFKIPKQRIAAQDFISAIQSASRCYQRALSVYQNDPTLASFESPEHVAATYHAGRWGVSALSVDFVTASSIDLYNNQQALVGNANAPTISKAVDCARNQVKTAVKILNENRERNWYPGMPQNINLTSRLGTALSLLLTAVPAGVVVGHLSYIGPGLLAALVTAGVVYKGTEFAQLAYELSRGAQNEAKISGVPALTLNPIFANELSNQLKAMAESKKREPDPALSPLGPESYFQFLDWLQDSMRQPENLTTTEAVRFWCADLFH